MHAFVCNRVSASGNWYALAKCMSMRCRRRAFGASSALARLRMLEDEDGATSSFAARGQEAPMELARDAREGYNGIIFESGIELQIPDLGDAVPALSPVKQHAITFEAPDKAA